MVKQWTDMAENVLQAPASARKPVAEKATGHLHSEWTNFDREPGIGRPRKNNKPSGRTKAVSGWAMTKGEISLAIAGEGRGWTLGADVGGFTIKRR